MMINNGHVVEAHNTLSNYPVKSHLHYSVMQVWMEILAATDCAPLQTVRDAARHTNMPAEERAVLDSYLFVDFWCRSDLRSQEELLLKYRDFVLRESGRQSVKNSRMHFKLCTRLLAYRQQNSKEYYNDACQNTLVVIGDSHSLVPAGKIISWGGKLVAVRAMPIRGIKMFHLGGRAPKKWRSYFAEKIKMIPPGSDVLLAIGEIDCRPDEGIFNATYKGKGESLQHNLEMTVTDFVTYVSGALASLAQGHVASITLMGIPAPGYDIQRRLTDLTKEEEFADFIAMANSVMTTTARRAGWSYLDVYAATKNIPKGKKSPLRLDDFHLSPKFYDQADNWRVNSGETSTLTLHDALQQAILHHRAGRLPDAERLYRAILQVNPKHPDANHNLGVLAVSVQQIDAALPFLKNALEANPAQGQYWISYVDALIRGRFVTEAQSVLDAAKKRGLSGASVIELEQRLGGPVMFISDLAPAIEHRELGRYQESATWLQSRLADYPQDAAAHAHLAHIYSLLKLDEQAAIAIKTALAINPDLPEVQRSYARLLLKQQKNDEAFVAAENAWRSAPQDPENQLVLAAVFGAKGQLDDAFHLLENALKSRPDYAEAFANRAFLKLRMGDSPGAGGDIEKALSLKPHLVHLWVVLGSLRYQAKDLPGAICALEKALGYEPANVKYMIDLGELKRQAGQIDAAMVLLEKAASFAPDNGAVWGSLGTILHEARRLAEAKTAYSKALAINPDQAEVASNLGVLAKEEENWTEALYYFEKSLALQPNRVEVMANMATALNTLERYEEAEKMAHRAIREDGTYVSGHLALSAILSCQKRFAEAEAVLDAVAPMATGNQEKYQLYRYYVSVFGTQEHWEKAEDLVRRMLEILPDSVEAHIKLGSVFHEQGRLDEAVASYRQALAYQPEYAEAYSNLGNVFKELVDLDKAISSYRQAVLLGQNGKAGMEAAVRLAVLYFLQNDLPSAAQMIDAASPLLGKPGRHLRPARAYLKYLNGLLSWWGESKTAPLDVTDINELHVIGDSHCLSAHKCLVTRNSKHYRCQAGWIEGCKQWHLGNTFRNRYKRVFESMMLELPPEARVLLTIGEIDCRYDEGMFKVWQKNRDQKIEDIVVATVDEYVKYVGQVAAKRGLRLIISGVPATNVSLESLTTEDAGQFVRMLGFFNKTLCTRALASGMDFLDIYSMTSSENGLANKLWHIDSWHLRPNAIMEAFEKYYLHEKNQS